MVQLQEIIKEKGIRVSYRWWLKPGWWEFKTLRRWLGLLSVSMTLAGCAQIQESMCAKYNYTNYRNELNVQIEDAERNRAFGELKSYLGQWGDKPIASKDAVTIVQYYQDNLDGWIKNARRK